MVVGGGGEGYGFLTLLPLFRSLSILSPSPSLLLPLTLSLHIRRSTLLMLVSAVVGSHRRIHDIYRHALQRDYRSLCIPLSVVCVCVRVCCVLCVCVHTRVYVCVWIAKLSYYQNLNLYLELYGGGARGERESPCGACTGLRVRGSTWISKFFLFLPFLPWLHAAG